MLMDSVHVANKWHETLFLVTQHFKELPIVSLYTNTALGSAVFLCICPKATKINGMMMGQHDSYIHKCHAKITFLYYNDNLLHTYV